MPRRQDTERYLGPYVHGRKFRVWHIVPNPGGVGSVRTPTDHATQAEALAEIAAGQKLIGQVASTVQKAIDLFLEYKVADQKADATVEDYGYSLAAMFPDAEHTPMVNLERPDFCLKLYTKLRTTPSKKTGRNPATDTHKNYLGQTKTFLRWCIAYPQCFIKKSGFESVKGLGKRKRGKKQLTIDEAGRFVFGCVVRANCGDQGAVAALICLTMGLRAREVAQLLVKDVDAKGTLLRVTDSKTDAGIRNVMIPRFMRVYFAALCQGKAGKDWLWDPARNGSGYATGKILEALTLTNVPQSAPMLAEKTGVGHEVCQVLLYRMAKNGLAARTARGLYHAVTEHGPGALAMRRERAEDWKPNRTWVLQSTKRLCREAGVTVVSAHSLRGLYATLATIGGMNSMLDDVAKAMGHENKTTTVAHYTDPTALANERQNRAMEVLMGHVEQRPLMLENSGYETPDIVPGPKRG